MLISDVYLDGAISEVATRRSELAAILKNDGVDELIVALLRGKVARDLISGSTLVEALHHPSLMCSASTGADRCSGR